MDQKPDPKHSLTLPASYIQATFIEFRHRLAQECPECRETVMDNLRRDFPWLHTMLLNDAEHPNELVLR